MHSESLKSQSTFPPKSTEPRPEHPPEVPLAIHDLTVAYHRKPVLWDVELNIPEGKLVGIVGPNGAGKSSMLNVISGFYHPQEGEVWFHGKKRPTMRPYQVARQGIARTFQNIALFEGMSVLDNIMTGRLNYMKSTILDQALWWGKAEREETENRAKVEEIIDFLEIQSIRKTPVGRLPYGLKKRVELGRALAAQPKLLLLESSDTKSSLV